MKAEAPQRQTWEVEARLGEFVHHMAGGVPLSAAARQWVATCRTPYPALRCQCGMFDIVWRGERR